MKKRIISIIVAVCLALCLTLTAQGAATLSNFAPHRDYRGEFTDVLADAWYFESIRGIYEYGIMDGKSASVFDPSGSLTIAETIKLAACLHKGYYTGGMDFAPGSPWYAPYVEYALDNGIIDSAYSDYSVAATRSDFATIIDGAVPDEAITPINRVVDGAIPDVYEYYSYGQAVYKLYRAGILTGSDSEGTFYPGRTLTRAEAATIIMRVVQAGSRQTLSLATPLSAEQVYKLATPAVFYIEVFDENDLMIKTGSGFFISDSGLAVTNYHVVIGAYKMTATLDGGDVVDIAGIYDFNWKNDIALIKLDVEDVPYLELADPSELMTGATVYTLGSPLGMQATFSKGIVSQASREIDGLEYIQLDAPISSGSSGGALLDTSCRVVGVTCATAVGAQNINLAMPISTIDDLSLDTLQPLKSILIETPYYEGYFPAPDFGAYFNVKVFNKESSRGGTAYSYRLSEFPLDNVDIIIDEYTHLIEQNLFIHTNDLTSGGVEYKLYYNSVHDVTITIGKDIVKNLDCFTITVY